MPVGCLPGSTGRDNLAVEERSNIRDIELPILALSGAGRVGSTRKASRRRVLSWSERISEGPIIPGSLQHRSDGRLVAAVLTVGVEGTGYLPYSSLVGARRVIMTKFGKQLRAYRVMAGLTQKDLAAAAGTSQDYVSNLERGRHLPGVPLVVRLASAVGVDWRSLVFDLVVKR